MQDKSPKDIIDLGAMSAGQWLAVLVTVGLNALDGFDVLSISFASPGIAKDWGLNQATLGWVLSMELVGMALGSVLLGGVADKIGRRPTILGCLLAMSVGMFGASHASGVSTLLIWRLLTGFGIGGMLASINAAAAELSSQRWRSVAVSLMVIGYPVGGVVGGTIVQSLLAGGTWHSVFIFGGWVTAAFIPIVWLLLPESVAFLDRQRKPGALEAINRILTRFGHESMPQLTPDTAASAQRSVMDILKPGLIVSTLLITLGYFAHVVSFYFIIKWVPKLVVDITDYGYQYAGIRPLDGGEDVHIRTYHFVMPFHQIRPSRSESGLPMDAGHIWVPMDDENCMVYNWMYSTTEAPLTNEDRRERGIGNGPDFVDQKTFRSRQNRSNNYGLDREVQRTESYTGIDGVNTQDRAVQEGMGPIVDRSKEHLGPADRAIIATRRLLLDAVKTVQAGSNPPGVDTSYYSARAIEKIFPRQETWRETVLPEMYAEDLPVAAK